MRLETILLTVASLTLGACGGEPPDLVGTYRSSGDCKDEILTLTRGDTFMHSYDSVIYEGRWRAHDRSITFSPFRPWNPTAPEDERPEAEGVRASYVNLLTGGSIRIDIGAGCEFIKR